MEPVFQNRIKLISDGTKIGTWVTLSDHPDVRIPFTRCEIRADADSAILTGRLVLDLQLMQLEWNGVVKAGDSDVKVAISSNGLTPTTILTDEDGNDMNNVTAFKIVIDAAEKYVFAKLTMKETSNASVTV